MIRIRTNLARTSGIGGRIFGSLFFLVFLAMGLLFCGFILREVYHGAKTYSWKATECVILESRVDETRNDERPYRFAVRYEYQWNGRTYSSEKGLSKNPSYSDFSDAQQLVTRYALDSKATCYVNPANPAEALLQRPSLWIGLMIFLPLIFVAIGGIGLFAMWSKKGDLTEPGENPSRPISSKATKDTGRKFLTGFLALFFVVGAIVFYFMTARPLLNVLSARNWVATPCTIISSRVQTHRGDDSTTYRVDILYQYEVDGREHRSNRYQFIGGSSSGYRGKARIVSQHPVGSKRTCYVNPRAPTEAILERGPTKDMWFGAIPVVFMLVGAGGIIGTWRSRANSTAGSGRDPESVPIREITGSSSLRSRLVPEMEERLGAKLLKPASARLTGTIAIGIFSLIWNGVLYFAFIRESGLFRRGSSGLFDWVHLVFMLPFLAVGLILIGVCIYQALALFNPKVEVTIVPGAPTLGGPLNLTWRLTGRTQMLRNLTFLIEAREEATYRRGTRTTTDKKAFLQLPVASATDGGGMSEGRASVELPIDTMPTFQADNNRIVWTLKVTGQIPRWPDLKEEFVIEVHPAVAPPAV